MHIRSGSAADLEPMYLLDRACFTPPFRFTRNAMRHYIFAPGAFSLVAEQEGTFAGFVVIQIDAATCDAYIVTLDVAPSWRRRGVARLLLADLAQEAQTRGAQSISLHVFVENAPAIRFYESLSFSRTVLHTDFYGQGMDAWGYRKSLMD